ncbi:hypothetical protein [Demequina gelatinilytica]|uniref:hypothetical protein n=1 Tax=Demequina gelatinilytica TaxID=1638980 RepID=UPI00078204E7|nr:hypothetical protein [Demequina gelatinilytica]
MAGRGARVLIGGAVGVGSALLGLAPWLVTGARLPLQNIWLEQTLPEEMPTALLPLNQYYVASIAAMLVLGGAFAGAVLRILRRHGTALPAGAAATGVALVQLVALVQSTLALRSGLGDDGRSQAYVAALVAGSAVCVVLSAAVLVALARYGTAGAAVALGAAGIASMSWLDGLVLESRDVASLVYGNPLTYVREWLPILVVAGAAAWSGFVTVRRSVATVVILVMLWVVPATTTAVAYVLTPIYLKFPEEIPAAGLQVMRMALGPDGGAVARMAVAVAAVAGVAVWRIVAGRRSGARVDVSARAAV